MKNFISDCLRTEAAELHRLVDTEGKECSAIRLIHAQMGMQTETAEFTDALKKSLFYGKPLDTVNLKEELGDLMWYVAVAMDELDTNFAAEAARVVSKLEVRYPEKFTNDKAENRDLETERKVLEE